VSGCTYTTCWLHVGYDAVTWIQKKLALASREQAVAIGEALMHRGKIYHVLHNEPFADSKTLYYRFSKQSEEDDDERNGIGSRVC
jgi:hypothetical protein